MEGERERIAFALDVQVIQIVLSILISDCFA
jgi:hypothetical protein